MIIDRNNKVYSTVKRKYAYSVQIQIYMVYQGKMDLRKIKNSISLCTVKLKEDIYDIRYKICACNYNDIYNCHTDNIWKCVPDGNCTYCRFDVRHKFLSRSMDLKKSVNSHKHCKKFSCREC